MQHQTRWSAAAAAALVLILGATASTASAQCQQSQKFIAQNGSPLDRFGSAVAIEGDIAVVGAPSSPKSPNQPGAAYIYIARDTIWEFAQEISASDGEPQNRFGSAVDISGDLVVIGASSDDDQGPQAGAVYVFRRQGDRWVEEQKLNASDGQAGDHFGFSVAVSDRTVLIGAWMGNALYVFRHNGAQWEQEQKLTPPKDADTIILGYSVAIDGDVAVGGGVAGDDKGEIWGTAHLYRHDGNAWVHEQQLFVAAIWATGFFGVPVAISGDVTIVGAFLDSEFGIASGATYVFQYNGAEWVHETTLRAPDPEPSEVFGCSVDIHGHDVIVGARGNNSLGINAGAAYHFHHANSAWSDGQVLLASDGEELDFFGVSVAVHDAGAIVGAPSADPVGDESGTAYLFSCEAARACDADLTDDGIVDVLDLLIVLTGWGGSDELGDITGDGVVDVLDLLAVLSAWGDCPA